MRKITEKARLVALVHGWPPYAEPLDCDDVKGPRSLFGESAPVPKPVPSTPMLFKDEEGGGPKNTGSPDDLPAGSRVLWESADDLDPVGLALRIHKETGTTHGPRGEILPALEVPAPTYLGGRCASTFTLAWKLLENGLLPAWGAVLCSCQAEGRGQLRRPWHSPRGNLYVSFRLPADPNLRGDAASLVVGGLLVRAFGKLGFPLSLKWPNDLLIEENAKAGGLLLEERDGVILAGLGINLAEAPPAALLRADRATRAAVLLPHHVTPGSGLTACRRPPVKNFGKRGKGVRGEAFLPLSQDEPLAPFALWRHLVSAAILEYTHLFAGQELARVLAGFDRFLAWKGKDVTLTEPDGSFISGRYQGVGERGGLVLGRANGSAHEYFSGSLSLTDAVPPFIPVPLGE